MTLPVWAALLVGLLGGAADPNDPYRGQRQEIQGTWVVVSAESGGRPARGFQQARLAFAGDRATLKYDGLAEGYTFRLYGTGLRRYPGIDLVPDRERDDLAPVRAIYSREGDQLWICLSPEGDVRPAGPWTEEGSDSILLHLRRERP